MLEPIIIVSIRVQATCVLMVTNPETKAQNNQNLASLLPVRGSFGLGSDSFYGELVCASG